MATSVPLPIATPTSALFNATASFIPSPTMIVLASFFSFFTLSAFPSGRTFASTSSIPAFFAMASATFSLSPVSMTTFSPIFFISLMAFVLSLRRVSETAIKPRTVSSKPNQRTVLPSASKASDLLRRSDGILEYARASSFLPPHPFLPSIIPSTPKPGSALNEEILFSFTLSFSALFFMAFERGCSLSFSKV